MMVAIRKLYVKNLNVEWKIFLHYIENTGKKQKSFMLNEWVSFHILKIWAENNKRPTINLLEVPWDPFCWHEIFRLSLRYCFRFDSRGVRFISNCLSTIVFLHIFLHIDKLGCELASRCKMPHLGRNSEIFGRSVDGGTYFRMRIILGTVLIWFLLFSVNGPKYSRNGSGLHPDLWAQKEFVWRTQRD